MSRGKMRVGLTRGKIPPQAREKIQVALQTRIDPTINKDCD